jgi:hypothetical protein
MTANDTPTRARCQGCGQTFQGVRGLRSHQSGRHVSMACRPVIPAPAAVAPAAVAPAETMTPAPDAFEMVTEGIGYVAAQWYASGTYATLDEAVHAAYTAFVRRLAAEAPHILAKAARVVYEVR